MQKNTEVILKITLKSGRSLELTIDEYNELMNVRDKINPTQNTNIWYPSYPLSGIPCVTTGALTVSDNVARSTTNDTQSFPQGNYTLL